MRAVATTVIVLSPRPASQRPATEKALSSNLFRLALNLADRLGNFLHVLLVS